MTVASVAARIGALISMILVARILGNVVYGEFSLIRSTVNGFVVLASFGMGRTATKYVAELAATDRARVGRVIALNYVFSFVSSVVVAAFFCFLAPLLYRDVPDASRLMPEARLSSILLVLSAIVSAQAGVMSGFKAFRGLAVATAASGLGSVAVFFLGGGLGVISALALGGGPGGTGKAPPHPPTWLHG
ncbi:MAG: oligosaccharide flippase family protein [Thermoguttaceae bacterium]|nr:oligosaccharide flippase family protein [Thermoguttaceae bacterium]